jgi:hypothetical protein
LRHMAASSPAPPLRVSESRLCYSGQRAAIT